MNYIRPLDANNFITISRRECTQRIQLMSSDVAATAAAASCEAIQAPDALGMFLPAVIVVAAATIEA